MSQDVTAEALQDIKNKQLSLFQLILEQLVQVRRPQCRSVGPGVWRPLLAACC